MQADIYIYIYNIYTDIVKLFKHDAAYMHRRDMRGIILIDELIICRGLYTGDTAIRPLTRTIPLNETLISRLNWQ